MVFIETSIFTKRISSLLSDDEYKDVQMDLILQPDKGAVIKGSNGLRKLRCKASGKGKRGGARIIYYWIKSKDRIHYQKNEMEDLTKDDIKKLSQIIEKELP